MRLAVGYLHMPYGTIPLRACATLYMVSNIGTQSQHLTQIIEPAYRPTTNYSK